jgi:hypothetical protein
MRRSWSALALAFAAVLLAPAPPANAAISDKLCPEATKLVAGLSDMKDADQQQVYEAARKITAAYEDCAKTHVVNMSVEPGAHYAYTREAGYDIVAARALVALHRTSEAKTLVLHGRHLAQDVYDWRGTSTVYDSSSTSSRADSRPSVYRAAAKEIMGTADALLKDLAAPAATAAPPPANPYR